jgi:hypothetical protein
MDVLLFDDAIVRSANCKFEPGAIGRMIRSSPAGEPQGYRSKRTNWPGSSKHNLSIRVRSRPTHQPAIGNLATTTGAASSTFMWDHRNRMIRAWVSGATSTYQYDHTTARMRQVVGSTTTDYPNKFFSIATAPNTDT